VACQWLCHHLQHNQYRRALNSPSKLAVALKMEVNNKNILLLPVKEAVNAYLKGIAG